MKKYRRARVAASSENPDHVLNVAVPVKCSSCGFGNYNIWGTVVSGRYKLEVRCMKCGKTNNSFEHIVVP